MTSVRLSFFVSLCVASVAHAVPVKIQSNLAETAINQQFGNHLRPQGISLRGKQLYWVDDVQLSDEGRMQSVEVGSILKTVDAIGTPREIECVATFALVNQNFVFDPSRPLNPSCRVNATPSPLNKAKFASLEWYPHSGAVDRASFKVLYDAFDLYLTRRGYFTPTWNRDSWMLRAAVDSNLQIQRLWIFASALIDRESLNIEKRADCHGEVHRVSSGKTPDDPNAEDVWTVFPNSTCRIQMYRFENVCYGPQASDCEREWSPCDGQSCTEPTPQTRF